MVEIHCLAHRRVHHNDRHRRRVHVRVVHVPPNAPKRQKSQKTDAPSPPSSMAESHMVILVCVVCVLCSSNQSASQRNAFNHHQSSPPSQLRIATMCFFSSSKTIYIFFQLFDRSEFHRSIVRRMCVVKHRRWAQGSGIRNTQTN